MFKTSLEHKGDRYKPTEMMVEWDRVKLISVTMVTKFSVTIYILPTDRADHTSTNIHSQCKVHPVVI